MATSLPRVARIRAERPVSEPKAVVFDEDGLAKCVREWQDRLGLGDWQFAVRIGRARNMTPDSSASLVYTWEKKTGLLEVRSPLDCPDECGTGAEVFVQDMEADVVHELLHAKLHTWQTAKDSFEEALQEQVIDDLARVLVCLKRQR